MGRDVTGIRTNKGPNPVKLKPDSSISQETAHVSPKISGLHLEEKDHEPNPLVTDSTVEENQHRRDVERTKKMDSEADDAVLQPQVVDREPLALTGTPLAGGEKTDSSEKNSNKIKNIDKPTNAKNSQPNSPTATRQTPQSDSKKQFDDEDNFSVASFVAASAKTAKFKTTIPVAPVFTCVARAEKRKQSYSKLEEKQAAMEADKLENEARIKEKEQAIIRQLRKNMVFKANPMPSFYQEGPSPKAQLKKLPVTHAKTPKLSRRKSFGDVMRGSSLDEKGKENQHTVGSHRNQRQTAASPPNNTSSDQQKEW